MSQIDWEYSATQVILSVLSPRELYKLTKYRKQTKDTYSRDDFGVIIITTFASLIMVIAHSIAMSGLSFYSLIKSCMVTALMLYGLGLGYAALCRHVAQQHLRTSHHHIVESHVELAYSFDIHVNGALWILAISVPHFLLLPILTMSGLLSCLLSNVLVFVACAGYSYHTMLGYNSMPFLAETEGFFYIPSFAAAVFCVISFAVQVNLSAFVCGLLF